MHIDGENSEELDEWISVTSDRITPIFTHCKPKGLGVLQLCLLNTMMNDNLHSLMYNLELLYIRDYSECLIKGWILVGLKLGFVNDKILTYNLTSI